MSKDLTVLNDLFTGENSLSVQSADDLRALDALSNSTSYLQRMQLYAKGKMGPNGSLIDAGHYGVPKSSDMIEDRGTTIDVIVIDRKAKALDMSDLENIIVSHDVKSKEFERIVYQAENVKDSGCAFGPCYLIYERVTKQFYEFFCGNKSGRRESANINLYLPVTKQMIEEGLTTEKKPRFSKPLTLGSVYSKKGNFEWFSPTSEECLTPFDMPEVDAIRSEIERFRKNEEPEVETVDDSNKSKRKR